MRAFLFASFVFVALHWLTGCAPPQVRSDAAPKVAAPHVSPQSPHAISLSREKALGIARAAPRYGFGGIIFVAFFCLVTRRSAR
jgi:hypothetical protein